MRAIALLLTTLLLAACGSDPTCKVKDNGDGTRTIRCPGADPVRVVAGDADAICTLADLGEGNKAIQCSDGTYVEIRDGFPIFPGSGLVAGSAQLFGEVDHSGIRVSVEVDGQRVEVVTGADGAYELTLPAGIHAIRFEAEGRVPVVVKNVPVINGTWWMPPVQLKLGERVGGPQDEYRISPAADALLIGAGTNVESGGWLYLHELDADPATGRRRLGTYVTSFEFDATGRRVLYQERTAIDGPLRIHDRETGETTTVSERSMAGWFVQGGAGVLYEARDDDGLCELVLWRAGTERVLGSCRPRALRSPFETVVVARDDSGEFVAWVDAAGRVLLQSVAGGAAHEVGSVNWVRPPEFLPGTPKLLVFEATEWWLADLKIVDGPTGEIRQLGTQVDPMGVRIAPAGTAISFYELLTDEETGTLLVAYVHEVRGNTTQIVAESKSVVVPQFSPDGRWAAWTDELGLHVLDLGAPENRRTWAGMLPVQWAFTAHGKVVALSGPGLSLWLWDPVGDTYEELDPAVTSWSLSPDGERVLASLPTGLLLVDLVDRTTHRLDRQGVVASLASWQHDSQAVFWVAQEAPNLQGLVRWAPPEDPVTIAASSAFGPIVGGANGMTVFEDWADLGSLYLFHADEGRAVPVDVPVEARSARIEQDLLLYRISRLEGEDAARNGLYVVRLSRL